mmetsp:Transcript_75884/g.245742  ORF Transcript_75884/g.245742 Transcript_75884/m.245742 type:complete len:201 (-) Transcript_75884:618-1220(-)
MRSRMRGGWPALTSESAAGRGPGPLAGGAASTPDEPPAAQAPRASTKSTAQCCQPRRASVTSTRRSAVLPRTSRLCVASKSQEPPGSGSSCHAAAAVSARADTARPCAVRKVPWARLRMRKLPCACGCSSQCCQPWHTSVVSTLPSGVLPRKRPCASERIATGRPLGTSDGLGAAAALGTAAAPAHSPAPGAAAGRVEAQ